VRQETVAQLGLGLGFRILSAFRGLRIRNPSEKRRAGRGERITLLQSYNGITVLRALAFRRCRQDWAEVGARPHSAQLSCAGFEVGRQCLLMPSFRTLCAPRNATLGCGSSRASRFNLVWGGRPKSEPATAILENRAQLSSAPLGPLDHHECGEVPVGFA